MTSAREQSSYPWQQPPDPHQQSQTFHLSGKCSQDVWVSQVRWCKRAKLVLSTWFFSREVRRGIGGREREREHLSRCVLCLVTQSSPTLQDPMDWTHKAPLSMWIFQARILEWVDMPSPRDLPNPGIKPRSPTLQVNTLPSEPLGKPKNPGVGSLSLLQGIFPTQELNQGFLHCRWILYQLSYQESSAH